MCCGRIGVRFATNQRYGCAGDAKLNATWSAPCFVTLVSGPPSDFHSAFRSINALPPPLPALAAPPAAGVPDVLLDGDEDDDELLDEPPHPATTRASATSTIRQLKRFTVTLRSPWRLQSIWKFL